MKSDFVNWLHRIQSRVRALFRKEMLDADMAEEMRTHVELRTAENVEAGMPPNQARSAALRQFGWIESIQETCRVERRGSWVEDFVQDFRYGCRVMLKKRAFTVLSVLTLALGIGANTAIFSLVDVALLRALPFPDSDRLVVIWADNPRFQLGTKQVPPANADVAAWREQTRSFARLAAFVPRTADLASGGDPERLGAAGITAGFFETLGISPSLGRTLGREEEAPGGPPVALISHALWRRRFGADPALVGKSILIDGGARTVVGILPPEFDFPRGAEWPAYFPSLGRTDVWLPLGFRAADDGTGWSNWQSREERGVAVIGRLKREVTLREAQAEMDAYSSRESSDHPDSHKDWTLKVVPLREQLSGGIRTTLLTLLAAVGLLMLIACVNVANLLFARGMSRQQEIAVRAALGAGRRRLFRQLLTECLVLAAFGATLGLLAAQICLRVFVALNPIAHSRLNEASLNPAVLGFAVLTALVTTVIFGLAPAAQASRLDLRTVLQESGRGAANFIHSRTRNGLIATEVALALVLLSTAGLMIRSYLRLQAVQPGFRSDSVLAFDLQLPGTRYPGEKDQVLFFKQMIARLETVPGVRVAGAISYLPLDGGENMGSFEIEGEPPTRPEDKPNAERRIITPAYFAAMGIPVQRGRVFSLADEVDKPRVVVINETLARQFFPDRDALGQRLKVGGTSRTIVGIVADVRSASLEREVRPQVYLPHEQWPWAGMTVVLRTEGEPLSLASAIRGEVRKVDGLLPVAKVRTMRQVVGRASSVRRFNMALLTAFAAIALLLTIVGIYGVIAFLVGRRTQEIGIRMALGAQRRDVVHWVMAQGIKPVAVGSLIGLAASLAISRAVASQLYGISSRDIFTLASTVVLIFAAALVACWLPARRAARVDPIIALRCE
jgi:putative ABC transport system permease protein